jgi:hypothetical protein
LQILQELQKRGGEGEIRILNEHLGWYKRLGCPMHGPIRGDGQIRLEMQNQFANFEENKARQKELLVAYFSESLEAI